MGSEGSGGLGGAPSMSSDSSAIIDEERPKSIGALNGGLAAKLDVRVGCMEEGSCESVKVDVAAGAETVAGAAADVGGAMAYWASSSAGALPTSPAPAAGPAEDEDSSLDCA